MKFLVDECLGPELKPPQILALEQMLGRHDDELAGRRHAGCVIGQDLTVRVAMQTYYWVRNDLRRK